jgi:Kef-type K+ transport system membrane component KefB
MGKLRIPHIIGMVLAGVLVGKNGFNILARDDSFELFGRVGLYYIMFLAALEMNLESVKRNSRRLIIYGALTFCIPLVMTYFIGVSMLHYLPAASWLLGCIMASNTLVSYPIISRYGLQKESSVTLSVGATMIALTLALIFLAAIVAGHTPGSGTLGFWLWFVMKILLYCALLIWLVPRLTRWFLRRYSDAVMQFIFVMVILFLCAALSDIVGLEGIFGAFLAGLILNRYIPQTSPLMNRIEFIGNALFIPYFLIGVGMLINVRLIFSGGSVLKAVFWIVLIGTLGKAVAAYVAGLGFRMSLSSANMMFGLTSAHAAGAIAMVMVGIKLKTADGQPLVSDDMLNGIVIMILFTCIISSLMTEHAARQITLRNKELPAEEYKVDEKILIPVRYPEYANSLVNLAMMMRDPKRNRGLVGLSVAYDDEHVRRNQEAGKKILEQVTKFAASADVKMETQVRVAANIANGIMHAFKEFQCSEIVIGMHMHYSSSPKFWGQFHQSLFNGLNYQIIMARLMQPLSTLRRIVVCVPSRAEFEPGFYRWLSHLCRLAENLDCRMEIHGRSDTLRLIKEFISNNFPNARVEFINMEHWNQLPELASQINDDHIFVIVTARKGTVSYKAAMDRLPDEIMRFYSGKNLMIIFPDQFGVDKTDKMTFAQPQHTEDESAYSLLGAWLHKKLRRV